MSHHILVVDDEPALAASLTELLRDEGYQVKTASDGAQALALLFGSRFDLVVSDVVMPRIDGLKLVDALRSRGDRTPVILMSATGRPRLLEQAVWTVAKPFELELILGLIGEIFAIRAVPPQNAAHLTPFASDSSNPY